MFLTNLQGKKTSLTFLIKFNKTNFTSEIIVIFLKNKLKVWDLN